MDRPVTSFNNTPIPNAQNLTQLTLQDMQQDTIELPNGYLLPPPRTRFQCFLPPLLDN